LASLNETYAWLVKRSAVSTVDGVLETLDLRQSPDKILKRIQSLFMAAKTITNFQEKLHRLYEQARHAKTYKRSEQDAWGRNDKPKSINTEIENYTRGWHAWARGGLRQCGNLLEL